MPPLLGSHKKSGNLTSGKLRVDVLSNSLEGDGGGSRPSRSEDAGRTTRGSCPLSGTSRRERLLLVAVMRPRLASPLPLSAKVPRWRRSRSRQELLLPRAALDSLEARRPRRGASSRCTASTSEDSGSSQAADDTPVRLPREEPTESLWVESDGDVHELLDPEPGLEMLVALPIATSAKRPRYSSCLAEDARVEALDLVDEQLVNDDTGDGEADLLLLVALAPATPAAPPPGSCLLPLAPGCAFFAAAIASVVPMTPQTSFGAGRLLPRASVHHRPGQTKKQATMQEDNVPTIAAVTNAATTRSAPNGVADGPSVSSSPPPTSSGFSEATGTTPLPAPKPRPELPASLPVRGGGRQLRSAAARRRPKATSR